MTQRASGRMLRSMPEGSSRAAPGRRPPNVHGASRASDPPPSLPSHAYRRERAAAAPIALAPQRPRRRPHCSLCLASASQVARDGRAHEGGPTSPRSDGVHRTRSSLRGIWPWKVERVRSRHANRRAAPKRRTVGRSRPHVILTQPVDAGGGRRARPGSGQSMPAVASAKTIAQARVVSRPGRRRASVRRRADGCGWLFAGGIGMG